MLKRFGIHGNALMPLPSQRGLGVNILGAPISPLQFRDAVDEVIRLSRNRGPAAVYLANVHMLVESRRSIEFGSVLRRAQLVLPDGMPLVWLMRARGSTRQERVAGMDLLPALCSQAQKAAVPVYFLGATDEVLQRARDRIEREYPHLIVAGMESPPFRPLTEAEDAHLCSRIIASRARLLFVALGCPKQERWIDDHQEKLPVAMVGVGAALEVFAGVKPRAPLLLQEWGLEWLFRLWSEPGRLAGRYLTTNAMFVWYLLQALSRGEFKR